MSKQQKSEEVGFCMNPSWSDIEKMMVVFCVLVLLAGIGEVVNGDYAAAGAALALLTVLGAVVIGLHKYNAKQKDLDMAERANPSVPLSSVVSRA